MKKGNSSVLWNFNGRLLITLNINEPPDVVSFSFFICVAANEAKRACVQLSRMTLSPLVFLQRLTLGNAFIRAREFLRVDRQENRRN